jgi:hypothetical protein
VNLLRRSDGIEINVGAKSRLPVQRGDIISINTPGDFPLVGFVDVKFLLAGPVAYIAVLLPSRFLTRFLSGGGGYGSARRLFRNIPALPADAPAPVCGGSLQAFKDTQLSV